MKESIFWYKNPGGKTEIIPSEVINFLMVNGLRNYYPDSIEDSSPFLVKLKSNVVSTVNRPYIINLIVNHIKSNKDNGALNTFHKMRGFPTTDDLVTLPILEGEFMTDAKDKSYFFFENGIFEVTGKEIHRIKYSDVGKFIWKSQIIKHDIDLRSFKECMEGSEFHKFLVDITDHTRVNRIHRYNHLTSLIGYLLHTYKDKSNPRATFFIDEFSDGKANGGTGKSLLSEALGQIRKRTQEDGKSFSTKNNFALQQVGPDTKLLVFDDVKKGFDLEGLFPIISEGMQVEKKYQDRITIPFERSPKILFTSNYRPFNQGASYRRRIYQFELTNFYNDKNTPIMKFGHRFFEDWDKEQWGYFYSLMMLATKFYLNKGVLVSKPLYSEKLKSVNPEFLAFMDETIETEIKYNKKDLFEIFLSRFPKFTELSQRGFTNWLNSYAEIHGYKMDESHSGTNNYFRYSKPQ